MTLADVTSEGVLAAIAEFARLGRDRFVRSMGFGRGYGYYLDRDGQLYDTVPIVSYAHGFSMGTRLGRDDLRGQGEAVAQRLRALGFMVRHLPDLYWTREEIILACELVEANGWKALWESNEGVHALSRLLQSPAIHPLDRRYPDFRNPAGVARKTQNIFTAHPAHRGTRSHGSHLDREVVEDFLRDPAGMHAEAARIRGLLTDGTMLPDLDLDDEVVPAFVELESGGPPPGACRVVGHG